MIFHPDKDPETTSVDGLAYVVNSSLLWAGILVKVGTNSRDNDHQNNAIGITSDVLANRWDVLVRSLFLFDISGLPPDATLVSFIFSLYGNGKMDFLNITPDINIYGVTPAGNTAVIPADYNAFAAIPYCDTPITYANWVSENWNNLASNAAGLAALVGAFAGDGIMKIGCRNANYDVAAIAPGWISNKNSSLDCYYSDADPATLPGCAPKLNVFYTQPRVLATNIVTLEAMRNIEMSARGRLYVDQQGNFTYESRFARN